MLTHAVENEETTEAIAAGSVADLTRALDELTEEITLLERALRPITSEEVGKDSYPADVARTELERQSQRVGYAVERVRDLRGRILV